MDHLDNLLRHVVSHIGEAGLASLHGKLHKVPTLVAISRGHASQRTTRHHAAWGTSARLAWLVPTGPDGSRRPG